MLTEPVSRRDAPKAPLQAFPLAELNARVVVSIELDCSSSYLALFKQLSCD